MATIFSRDRCRERRPMGAAQGIGSVVLPCSRHTSAILRRFKLTNGHQCPIQGGPQRTSSIHRSGRSARVARFFGRVSHCVSKRPIWLAGAAKHCIPRWPTIDRIAGSRHRRSASFTSSYPASRRSKPAGRVDDGRSRRCAHPRARPAMSVGPGVSSSSR